MTFRQFSDYLQKLENTSSRLKMTEIIADLFKNANYQDTRKICYLLQGRVVPLFEDLEFGIATKMMIRAITQALEADEKAVNREFKNLGDLGDVVEKLKVDNTKVKIGKQSLTIEKVFDTLTQVAQAEGEGSQEEKINMLAKLIKDTDPLSARYIVRIPINKLRLGFSDMTILDGFSWMLREDKSLREKIEKAYNVYPDLGQIGKLIKRKGIEGLKDIRSKAGVPIRMAKADRLTSAKEILKKAKKVAIEFKYDGLRLQAHYKKTNNKKQKTEKDFVKLYSRNLENLTQMFPEIVESIEKHIKADEVIFEGEIVAYNPETGVSIPFQKTMQRRRKYNISKKAEEIPVKVYCFELLLIDGTSLLYKPYKERKAKLKEIVKEDEVLQYAKEHKVTNEKQIEELFEKAVNKGYEGIIAKKLEGEYEAGIRGWNWIKFKRAMSKRLMDTFDVLVMGYTKGEGKRSDFGLGQFLTGIWDEKMKKYVTLSKIGTGLTDEQFRQLKKRISPLERKDRPKEYHIDKLLEADVWLDPELVVEVAADEITRSQVHTAGRKMGPSKSGTAEEVVKPGYALRFPRLIRLRDDKSFQDVTTLKEVKNMYKSQKRSRKKV